jgi:transcriptional regulator
MIMYVPPAFAENDRALALSLMTADGFATVFTCGSGPEASHVPTMVEEVEGGLSIQFHLALANPQCEHLEEGSSCLIVYLGPHCYVSPSWYSEKPNVPTWNYLAVHAEGRVSILSSQALESQLAAFAARYEPKVGGDWALEQLPEAFKSELLQQIRGYRVVVSRLQAKSKLSQNRVPVDRQRVTRRLLESSDHGAQAVGKWMAAKSAQPTEP